ncbi:hypothetical protein FSST1_006421 [Fusarium sambucinum]
MPRWNVQEFSVTTTTGTTAEIYANGRMQCPITVLIKGMDTDKQVYYQLTDAELALIELIDYDLPEGSALHGEWNYSTKENEFSHIISNSFQPVKEDSAIVDPTSTDTIGADGSESQSVRFWVSTTRLEAKKIAARIKTPFEETFTTHSESFDYHVTVTCRMPIRYNKSNTSFTWEKIWNGKWEITDYNTMSQGTKPHWQDYWLYSYFFELKGMPVFKATIDGYYNGSKAETGGPEYDARMKNAFGLWRGTDDSRYLRLFFIWEMGLQTETMIGFEPETIDMGTDFVKHRYHAYACKKIPINQRKGTLCFSQLDFYNDLIEYHVPRWWIKGWYEENYAQNLAAFIAEPIQGWAGTIVPPDGYLKAVQALYRKHNVLFICVEVQAGYGRTGKDLTFQHEPELEPDMVIIGKAVTGGYYPMSIVMGKKHVMDLIQKNEILSTFSTSPISCAAALASLDVLEEERISERSERLGKVLKKTIKSLNPPHVRELRGTALFQSLVLDCSVPGVTPRRVSALAMHRGVLVGIGADRLRFSPPLTISEEDLVKAVTVVAQALRVVTEMGDFPGCVFIN